MKAKKTRWTRVKKRNPKQQALKHLVDNYTKAGSPIAFSGISALQRYYKGKLKLKDIKDFLKTQESYTKFRHVKKDKVHNPTYVYAPRRQIQLDLANFQDQGKYNRGFKYICVAIDCFTKKAWAVPIKNKKSDTVVAAVKQLFFNHIKKADRFVVDMGLEWFNAPFKKFCSDNNIKLYAPRTIPHATTAERFVQTLKALITRWCNENNTKHFIPALDSILQTYNSRFHRSIQMSPNEAESSKKKQFLIRDINEKRFLKIKKRNPSLREHQLVRIYREHGKFKRAHAQNFTDEIFIIAKVEEKLPIPLYTLTDLSGSQELVGKFTAWELTPVKLSYNLHVKEKLDTKGDQVLVTFHGLPFQAWINKDNLTS